MPPTDAAPHDNLEVALVGHGRWGRNIARNLHALGALGLVVDAAAEARSAAATAYTGVRVADSIDAVPTGWPVAIAAPAAEHGRLVRHFLERGHDVFVEKPLALTVQEGAALAKLADDAGRVLMVGHLLHYHPAVQTLYGLVDDGTLGRLRTLYSRRLNLGRFRREENILWSFAPHDISVLLRLVGRAPQRVIAAGGAYLHPRIADTTVTQLLWESGVHAHIHVSWLHPIKEQRLVVIGEDAMAVFDDRAPTDKLMLYRHGVRWRDGRPEPVPADGEPVAVPDGEPLRAEMQAFLRACTERGWRPPSDAGEALRVLSVLDAAERSLRAEGLPMGIAAPRVGGATVHPSAVVGPRATLGDGTRVWHFSHVMDGAQIGRGCVIGQNGFVAGGAVLGDNVRLQNNVSVYDGVRLEDDVFCGPSCVFTNVGRPRAHVSRRDEYETTVVGRGATIGANATVVCGHSVGHHAFVGAGAVVTRDVPPHALVVGNPARVRGWVCACGERLSWAATPAPDVTEACERCGAGWRWSATDGVQPAASI